MTPNGTHIQSEQESGKGVAAQGVTAAQGGGNVAKGSAKGAISNVAVLDAKNPIPIELSSNIFVSLKGKRYVPFMNPNDTFAQLLTEAKLCSTTTLACVGSKAQYCLGKGWYLPEGEAPKDMVKWARCVNRKNESLNDIHNGIFNDLFTAGNAYVQVVAGKVAGRGFVKLYRRNFQDCRLSMPDDDDVCNSVYVSKYFRKLGILSMNTLKTEEYPIYSGDLFDGTWLKDPDTGFLHTIFHLKVDASGYDYYGLPSNIGSLPEQILEYKAARYNIDNFENNMVVGGVAVIKGHVTGEELEKIGRNMVYTHTGDGKRGRWMLFSSESGDADMRLEKFDEEKEGSFVESDSHNEEKIYVANQWNKLLIGGSEKKNIGGGNSSYIRSVFDIANNTVIMPMQGYVTEKFLQPLMDICKVHMGVDWPTDNIGFKTVMPVTFLGDIDANSCLTINEGRELMGKDPLPGKAGEAMIKSAPMPATQDGDGDPGADGNIKSPHP